MHWPSKIICLGKNYPDHVREGGFKNPEKPMLFSKGMNTLNGPYDPILLPASCSQVDWEVELAVVMGREGKGIRAADAYEYVAGFCVMNDVSGRDAQFGDGQFVIEYISRDITLMPGDIISTGTPSGVGIFRDPPILLQPGSVVTCEIEKIGAIANPVR